MAKCNTAYGRKNSIARIEKESKNINVSVNLQPEASVNEGRYRRGRKPAGESRATEIRARLMVWKRTPEASRGSVRALAAEIGTSHQLLSFYLGRWDKWQAKEYHKNANHMRACARAENRVMTNKEVAEMDGYCRAARACELDSVVRDILRRIKSKCGEMSKQELQIVKILARKGNTEAKEMLGQSVSKSIRIVINPKMLMKVQNNLPRRKAVRRKSFR